MENQVTISHDNIYLNLLKKIVDKGEFRSDRTGTGTISIFGEMMKFDLRDKFPLLTTKKLNFDTIKKELLWFISGSTNSKILEEQGINIWKGNSSKEFLSARNLDYEEGEIGPGYGFQWRYCGANYPNKSGGIDQLKKVIEDIKSNPTSRRHIVSSWDVCNIDKMALPPCHCFFQFYVEDEYLDCMMYQRSGDMFLGVPFNIASYSLLLLIIAKLTGLKARYFNHVIGDAHIYSNHIEQAKLQLSREPYDSPTITLLDINDIDDINPCNIILENYNHHPFIKAQMAV